MDQIITNSDFNKIWNKFRHKDEFLVWMEKQGFSELQFHNAPAVIKGEWLEDWAKEMNRG
jgi:hypothetical protein